MISNWPDVRKSTNGWIWVRLAFTSIADSGAFIGAVGAVGCGVLAWTYQAGSARLGVIDLFACEITTLCRVAVVVEMVKRYIELFQDGPEVGRRRDIDGESPTTQPSSRRKKATFRFSIQSVKELQSLEADVVKHVTAFYTYMKVMRDSSADWPRSLHRRPASRSAPLAPCDLQCDLHAVSRAGERTEGNQGPDRIRADTGGGDRHHSAQ